MSPSRKSNAKPPRRYPARTQGYDTLAAVDLGSNSFRLQVGRVVDDQIYELDSIKETVRLAAGLDPQKNLSEASQQAALAALKRFGERLRGFAPEAVRAVGTNTLRVAKNAAQFLAKAEEALGFPIEVIAGREEARLIYVGVSHGLPAGKEKRLVVDIGGGSTECIVGSGHTPIRTESLYMGCVSYTQRFFADGKIDSDRLQRAELAARTELQTIAAGFHEAGWTRAVASSGTARSLGEMLRLSGWSEEGINRNGLKKLRAVLLKAGDIRRLSTPGLTPDRAPVIFGGFAIMSAVFDELHIEHAITSDYALRHGVLYDLLGRYHHADMREATVAGFMRRYQVDRAQAERVETYVRHLYDCIPDSEVDGQRERDQQLLIWAARLHEVGISIAYNGYHKHSAYIVQNADMPGFSRMEQAHLAALVHAHRGALAKVQAFLPRNEDWPLVLVLRLAALLSRRREGVRAPPVKLVRRAGRYDLAIDRKWLKSHPLTETALHDEIAQWQALGFELRLKQ
jgi:exopolyphosphatase/guanosine-5'-triphosphate,3'-diphosphate pyrophosphatase